MVSGVSSVVWMDNNVAPEMIIPAVIFTPARVESASRTTVLWRENVQILMAWLQIVVEG